MGEIRLGLVRTMKSAEVELPSGKVNTAVKVSVSGECSDPLLP